MTAPGVLPPTVEAASDVTGGAARLSVAFTATGADPDGDASKLAYAWDFGDGGKSDDQNPTHVYGAPGVFAAKVTVTDASGATATKTLTITVTHAPGNGAPTVEEAYGLAGFGGNPMEVQFSARAPIRTVTTHARVGLRRRLRQGLRHRGQAHLHHARHLRREGDGEGRRRRHAHVHRARDGRAAANLLPTVAVEADPRTGTAPLTVRFSSRASDPDGTDLKYTWAFGDGGGSAEPQPRPRLPGGRRVHGDADGRRSARRARFGAVQVDGHGRAGLARPGCDDARRRAARRRGSA